MFSVYYSFKRCGLKRSLEMDGESLESCNEPGSEKDKQVYALDSSVFQCDENGNTEEKGKGTHL